MNKKIKIIELLNKIANAEEVPERIKLDGIIFKYENFEMFYCSENEKREDLLERAKDYSTWDFLNWNVELIEEDKIDIQSIEEIDLFDNGQGYNNIKTITAGYDSNFSNISDKLNQVIQAVKQLDKQIQELKKKEV